MIRLDTPSGFAIAPPFRWPGGKRSVIPSIDRHVPPNFHRYFEPFAGGAALFFHLCPRSAVLSDHNVDLMNFYAVLRDRRASLQECLERLPTDEAGYYVVRKSFPGDAIEKAARFIYLTTLAFNGIYRVNRQGQFNTPYGHRVYSFSDRSHLWALSDALQSTQLMACDFEVAVETASAGDFVYFDPPYTVAHDQNGFLRYNERIYSFDDQKRLARVARRLAEAGCSVLVSNANHPSLLALYEGFATEMITRRSSVAADSSHRRYVNEVLISANTP